MKSIRIVNKPNPNNPNLKTDNHLMVATLDKHDVEVQSVFNEAEKIGSKHVIPMRRTKKGKLITHTWDLSNAYSIKVRLSKATIPDVEMIVLLKELMDSLHKIEKVQVQHIDFDIDKVFITENGTIAFLLWGVEGRVIKGNIITLFKDILESAEPSDSADASFFENLKSRIPSNREEYKGFVNTIYASYTKMIQSKMEEEEKEDSKSSNKEQSKKESKPRVNKKGVVSSKKEPKKETPKPNKTVNPLFSKMVNPMDIAEQEDKTTIGSDINFEEDSDKTSILDYNEQEEEVTFHLDRESTGEVFELHEGENVIGRGTRANIVITNNKTISGKHVSIILENGSLFVKDLASSNGTFIGGNRLSANARVQIEIGEEIRVSDENFIVGKGV